MMKAKTEASAKQAPGRVARMRVDRARYKVAAVECLERSRAARLSGNHRHAVIYGLWAASDRAHAARLGRELAKATGASA